MSNSQRSIWVGDTEPANPADTLWLSTALKHARMPGHPGASTVVVDRGATAVQEPNVWSFGGAYYMAVNIGSMYILRATDPRGPWTQLGIGLGGGNGGEAGSVIHPGIFQEGSKLYCFYTQAPFTTCKLATADASSPLVWTAQGAVLTKTANFLAGLASFGNFSAYRANNGKFRLMFEATNGTQGDSWISGLAEADQPAGPYSVLAGTLPSMEPSMQFGMSQNFPVPVPTSGLLEGYRSTYSCGPVVPELGGYTQVYHSGAISGGDGGVRSEMYRATSPDGINWSVDLGGYAIAERTDHRWEIDQIADPYPFKVGDVWWCAWTAASNANGRFVIKVGPMSPTLLIHDGTGWVPTDQQAGAGNHSRLRERPRYTSGPVFPFDDLPVDAAATANFAVTLPAASQGAEVRISNISTSTGTVLVSALAGDTILGSNAALTAGQMVVYRCLKSRYWVRMG